MVASLGEMAYIPDVSVDQRYLSVAANIRSFIAYPLKVESNVLGVLCIESVKLDGFAARDRRVLAAIADQMALAMSNGRQYATATERLATLRSLRDRNPRNTPRISSGDKRSWSCSARWAAVNSTLNQGRMLATAAEKIAPACTSSAA